MRYVLSETVQIVSVEEKFETLAAVQIGEEGGKKLYDVPRRSLGWFVHLSESSSVFVGHEKPELSIGDWVATQLIIEKVQR